MSQLIKPLISLLCLSYLSLGMPLSLKAQSGSSQGCTNGLGIQQFNQGKYQAALATFQCALAIAQKSHNKSQEGQILSALGLVHDGLGQYPKALSLYEQALTLQQTMGDSPEIARTLNQRGFTYKHLGQNLKALENFQQALDLQQKSGDLVGKARTLGNRGQVFSELGQLQPALNDYQQALGIYTQNNKKNDQAQLLNSMGLIYDRFGNNSQALTFYQQALGLQLELGDNAGKAVTLSSIGLIFDRIRDYPKALYFYKQALTSHQTVGNKAGEGLTLNNIGGVYLRQKLYSEAEAALFSAIKVWESLRPRELEDAYKVSIFDTQSTSYNWLQTVLVAQNKINEALEVAERGRARAFIDLMASRQANTPQTISPISIVQIQQIAREQQATLVEYSLVSSSMLYVWVIKPTGEVKFQNLDLSLLKQQPDLAAFSSTLRGGDSLLATLVQNTRDVIISSDAPVSSALNYSPGDRLKLKEDVQMGLKEPWQVLKVDSQKGVLTLTHPQFESGVSVQRPLSDVVQKVESGHAVEALRSNQKQLQALYQFLIAPLQTFLPTNPDESVIFIPHRELFLIPFAALQDEKGKFLIEKHTILSVPAIQVLELTHRAKIQRHTPVSALALVIGNPTMPSIPGNPPRKLPNLPGAEIEAKTVAQRLNTQPLLGNQATKANLMSQIQTVGLIHLATHGVLDDLELIDIPPGALALAPTSSDKGFLSATEVSGLKLSADLAILSACNTGRGRVTGDGVIGISRAFMTAGVPSVVVSLWSVPDAPTSELMGQFYQFKKTMSKAHALRQAMLTMMKKYPNPVDWAAFNLMGEAN
jgi:CHAT domain-containing protein/tetratricopeptide (TPR) repeat protein